MLADLRFVDGLIQMLDRLYAVSVEIMLCGFELMLGIAHRFKSFVDVGMRFRRSCAGWYGRKSCYGWNRRDRRLWSGCRRGECQGKEKCCHDEQSQQSNLFQEVPPFPNFGSDATDLIPLLPGTLLKLTQGDRDTAQYSRRFGARPVLQKVTRLMLHSMIVVGATTGRPEPIEVEYRPPRQVA